MADQPENPPPPPGINNPYVSLPVQGEGVGITVGEGGFNVSDGQDAIVNVDTPFTISKPEASGFTMDMDAQAGFGAFTAAGTFTADQAGNIFDSDLTVSARRRAASQHHAPIQ